MGLAGSHAKIGSFLALSEVGGNAPAGLSLRVPFPRRSNINMADSQARKSAISTNFRTIKGAIFMGFPVVTAKPVETVEEQLKRTLRRLRFMAGVVVEELDLDPAECSVRIFEKDTDRPLSETITLAECFAEADRLAPLE